MSRERTFSITNDFSEANAIPFLNALFAQADSQDPCVNQFFAGELRAYLAHDQDVAVKQSCLRAWQTDLKARKLNIESTYRGLKFPQGYVIVCDLIDQLQKLQSAEEPK